MNWNLVSKYRTQLMGISMLWIMLFHNFFKWTDSNWVKTLIDHGNVGVDIFLFLSGVGLYYSYEKKGNIGEYYKRRIVRLLIPYFVLAISFFFWVVRFEGGEYSFLSYISQVAFIKHNVNTTWFIPCILVLSLLFPIIYYLQNYPVRIGSMTMSRNSVTVLICSIYFILLLYLKANKTVFYNNTEIALTRALVFIVGCHFAKYVKEGVRIPNGAVLFSTAYILIYIYVFRADIKINNFWYRMSYVPLAIAWIVVFIWILSKCETVLHCKKFSFLTFIGNMTLELYLLHIFLRRIYRFYFGSPHIERTAVIDYFIVILASIVLGGIFHILFKKINNWILRSKSLQRSID